MEYTLRHWRLEDADSLTRYANNAAVAKNLRDGFPHPYLPEDAVQYIKSCLEAERTKKWLYAITVNDEAIGSIGVFRQGDIYRKSAELGYWLAEPFWGNKITSRAVNELCKQVFAQSDIIRIYAEPFLKNTASRRVLEKNRFVLEGILRRNAIKGGETLDSCIYALLKE